jgi:hypothetical protein
VKACGLKTTTATKKDCTLVDYDCGIGLATAQSVADGYFQTVDGVLRGIWEVKHGTDTPAEGLRQGAPEASNIALHHLALGVDSDDILVPVIASNGYLIQFAAVIMLKESFPVLIALSHVLDMTNDEQLDEAARLLCCVENIVSIPLKIDTGTSTPNARVNKADSMKLSDAFHQKPLHTFFAATGNIQTSLHRYFKIMARLHEREMCRPFVCFPICVREFEDNVKVSSIVFPKLTGYSIGLPETPELRTLFIQQLKVAISAFHAAGVVHMDLYLSNVMWRIGEDSIVEIKVIDWDAAHFVDEDLQREVRMRLEDGLNHRMNIYTRMIMGEDVRDHDDRMKWYDLSLVRVWEHFVDSKLLQFREKNDLDQACISAQRQMALLLERGGNDV